MSTQKIFTKPETHPTAVINANYEPSTMAQIIGKDGYYFKLTTENCNTDYIWYDDFQKKILIWGGEQESKNAFNILTKRCKNVYNRIHCQD